MGCACFKSDVVIKSNKNLLKLSSNNLISNHVNNSRGESHLDNLNNRNSPRNNSNENLNNNNNNYNNLATNNRRNPSSFNRNSLNNNNNNSNNNNQSKFIFLSRKFKC